MTATLSMLAAAMSGSSTSEPTSISSVAISMLWGTANPSSTTHWSRVGWHFDERADHSDESLPRVQSKDCNRNSDRQFEVVTRRRE